MMEKICITSVIVCVVTFLLFAFALWNINPAMWPNEARVGCAAAMAMAILIGIVTFSVIKGI